MEIKRFDLYEEYGIKRVDGAQGYLTAYIHSQPEEFCVGRTRPAVLVLAGGAYGMLSDREKECVALAFFAKGFNAFTLDYSIAPVKFPAQLLEGCMSIRLIRDRAEEFFIDKSMVSVIGFSAGGHLTGTIATMYDCDEIKKFMPDADSDYLRPDAVIFSYAVVTSGIETHGESINNICGDDRILRERVSVEKHIKSTTPPAFIWATVDDNCVPSENSLMLAAAYKKAGAQFELHIFEHGVHGLSLASRETAFSGAETNYIREDVAVWFDMAISWLKKHGFEINY